MEIEKSQYPQSSKIKDITQFHNIEYVYGEDEPPKCRVWRYYKIDKVFDLVKYLNYQNVKSPFRDNVMSVGSGKHSGPKKKRVNSFALMKTV